MGRLVESPTQSAEKRVQLTEAELKNYLSVQPVLALADYVQNPKYFAELAALLADASTPKEPVANVSFAGEEIERFAPSSGGELQQP